MTTSAPTAICPDCHKLIDPAFDSSVKDEHGQPWHTSCRVNRVGGQDRGDEVDLLSASPLLWLIVKTVGRFKSRKR